MLYYSTRGCLAFFDFKLYDDLDKARKHLDYLSKKIYEIIYKSDLKVLEIYLTEYQYEELDSVMRDYELQRLLCGQPTDVPFHGQKEIVFYGAYGPVKIKKAVK